MFVLGEPYISDLLLNTINKNGWAYTLRQDPAEKIKLLYDGKIYTNSENSIEKIVQALFGTDIPRQIGIFKDKVKTREFLCEIYPDYFFKKVSYEELSFLNPENFKYPLVIKPSVGFLSFGVCTVSTAGELSSAIEKIKASMDNVKGLFPRYILNADNFIIEDFIEGDEFALDVYFDENSKPVILNVFQHPFADKNDVSDRMYISSAQIIFKKLQAFENILEKIGQKAKLKNFPMHIELRAESKKVIPIEINPLRFAGWCTTDLAEFAYGINVYEYFIENKKPDWKTISSKNKYVYAFIMGEIPLGIKKSEIISFDIKSFKNDMRAIILEERPFDFMKNPVFCVLFIKADSKEQIEHILKLDMKKYIKMR